MSNIINWNPDTTEYSWKNTENDGLVYLLNANDPRHKDKIKFNIEKSDISLDDVNWVISGENSIIKIIESDISKDEALEEMKQWMKKNPKPSHMN